MKIPDLAKVLVIEGQVPSGDASALHQALQSADVLEYARDTSALLSAELVVLSYRVAAASRSVQDGINQNLDSLATFRSFSSACLEHASKDLPREIRALLIHNAASACARHNGNMPEQQDVWNKEAYAILDEVYPDYRGPAWWVVRTKVGVGLMESGAIPFDEDEYRQYITYMRDTQAKDHAGRVEFFVHWLIKQSRQDDAVQMVTTWAATEDTWSAPNQVERLRKLEQELNDADGNTNG